MIYLIDTGAVKPNRITTRNKDTDIPYHTQYARYCLGATNTALHNSWVRNTQINKYFYKGKQWFLPEDIEAFLKDDTGQTRNRIEIVHNVIRPMVEQYRGNAIRMSIDVAAKAKSIKAFNRRNEKLGEQLFWTELAKQVPHFESYIRKRYNIGRDKDETSMIFDNTYVDTYAEDITELIQEIGRRNEFTQKQVDVAESVAFSGLAVMEGYEFAGHLRWDIVQPEQFGWDRNAKRKDLQDSDYMFKEQLMLPTDVYEQWPDMGEENMANIENYLTTTDQRISEYNISTQGGTRIPTYHVYWRDSDRYEYGYVKDEFGYSYLTRINFIYPDEETPRYTDNDLITPPNTPRAQYLFKNGKKKRYLRVDTLRYCIMIPAEVLGQNRKGDKFSDIVLEYGLYPYQDTEFDDPSNVKFPFKCQTWAYIDGEVLSPIDDAINPQRFINRIMSATESQINNSGGSSFIYDKDGIDAQDGEDEFLRNVAQGKPAGLRSKGRGVPNAMIPYDTTPKAGTYNMFGLVSTIKQLVQDTTGVNEALKGESTGSDQLVGVTKILLQRGSLMQEPFYDAISSLFLQAYQYSANVGKRIYIESERELAIMVGDEGVKVLKLSKGLKAEDFLIYVERENNDELLKASADQTLDKLYQLQLIDDKIYANLHGRSKPADVNKFLRQFSRDKIEAARLAKEAEAGQAAEMEQKANQQIQLQNNIRQFERTQDFANQQTLQDKKNEGTLASTIASGLNKI